MFNWFRRKSNMQPVSPGTAGVPWHLPNFGRMANAIAGPQQLPEVYACAALIADSCGQLPLCLMRELPSGGSEKVVAGDTAAFLRGVGFQSISAAVNEAALGGNGFCIVQHNGRGGPESLVYHPAGLTTICRADDGSVWYEFRPVDPIQGQTQLLPATSVVHIRFRPSKTNPIVGVSPLEEISPALAGIVARRAGVDAVFQNVASPKTYLTSENKISPVLAARLKTEFEEKYGGRNQGRTLVLGEGLKMNTLEQNLVDLQTLELLQFDLLSVCRAFAIPPPLLGYLADGTRASVAEQNRSFASTCLVPWARRVGEALGDVLLAPDQVRAGQYISLDTGSLVRGYGNELADAASKLLNSGALTPNEVRNWLGLPDITGGEVLARPVNALPNAIWNDPEHYNPSSEPQE